MIQHKCEAMKMLVEVSWDKRIMHGTAIDDIFYDEAVREWVASNGEYAVIVRYCPFCGEELELHPLDDKAEF